MTLRPYLIQYLQYVKNVGDGAIVSVFDEDWEPIGPMLRKELVPIYLCEEPNGKLSLTEEGKALV